MIHWQDTVLSISILALNIALVPSLWGKNKPRLTTSLLTALFLLPQVLVFISLSLWYSLTMVSINSVLWIILAIQQARKKVISKDLVD
jgi:hypothetical protein